jgi:hypothetical protein
MATPPAMSEIAVGSTQAARSLAPKVAPIANPAISPDYRMTMSIRVTTEMNRSL